MGTKKLSLKARRALLNDLADFLDTEVRPALNEAKFDMSTWGEFDHKKLGRDDAMPSSISEARSCGFAGCAIGWGLMSPRLQEAGIVEALTDPRSGFYTPLGVGLSYMGLLEYISYASIAEFFGLDLETAKDIFSPEAYYTALMTKDSPNILNLVIGRLRDAAKGWKPSTILKAEHKRETAGAEA